MFLINITFIIFFPTRYYNEDTKSYEGIINYNIELEAINIWSLDKIIVGDKIITKDQLKDMGLNLKIMKSKPTVKAFESLTIHPFFL